MKNCVIRYAERAELERVNELRAMVHELHAQGRPDIFRPDFGDALQAHIYQMFDAETSDVIVALINNTVCGFAVVEYIDRPASPYNLPRRYYHIEEFGVDAACRRLGVASALIRFCKQEAGDKGFARIALDMWEFNESALAFYEAAGFHTTRRYMEINL